MASIINISIAVAAGWCMGGTRETLEKMDVLFPIAVKIIPVHSIVMPCENLQWFIHYLKTSRNRMQVAVNEDLIPEQTMHRSARPEFGGAAVFFGARPGLMELAAYGWLSKK